MNYRRLVLGSANAVAGLLALAMAVLVGLLTALPIFLTGLDASGDPVTAVVRFANLIVAVGAVGIAAAYGVAVAWPLSDAVSDRFLGRAAALGVASAALWALGLGAMNGSLTGFLVAALIGGLLVAPLAFDAWTVRSTFRREAPVVEDEPVRPSV